MPAWFASISQVPAPVKFTVVPLVPDTEHTPAAVEGSTVKTTGLPEPPPVAARVPVVPTVPADGGGKVIDWVAGATVTFCSTCGAGR